MTALKRKASQELTPNSVDFIEPSTFAEMSGMIWSFFRNHVGPIWEWPGPQSDLTSTDRSNNNDVTPNGQFQKTESRENRSTAVKRQRSDDAQVKKSPSKLRNSTPTTMNVLEKKSEAELRASEDARWTPAEFGAPLPTREPEIIYISDDDEDIEQEAISSRSSSPESPLSTPAPPSPRSPRYPLSHHRGAASTRIRSLHSSTFHEDTPLEQRLNDILSLDDQEDGEASEGQLKISAFSKKKHQAEAEARKQKEKAEAIRLARERRLTRRYPSKPLVQALEDTWEENIENALSRARKGGNVQITQSQGGTPLHLKDFLTLLGHCSWLNDEIINTYIEWIVEAANKAAKSESKKLGEPISEVPRFIAHNSFFYENLDKRGPSSTERLMKRKKAPGASLLEVDTVFVPICRGSHWTIGAVRPVARTIEYFDSLQGSPRNFIQHMRGWLKFQLGPAYKEEEWTTPSTGCTRQMNGYDCGVFVCTNALCVALGLDTSCYQGREMTTMRRNIAALLINKGFRGDFAWGQGVF